MNPFVLCLLLSPLQGDDVQLQDGANSVVIRKQPSASSDALGTLQRPHSLPLLGSVPNWRLVEFAGGKRGYVAAKWTKVVSPPQDFALDVVDVGTGLAIVVRGEDFTMVYDGGTRDDGVEPNRLVAYLKAAQPSLNIVDHLILSHPHEDHVNLLPGLLEVYSIRHVWDSGAAASKSTGYCNFVHAVRSYPNVRYHSPVKSFGARDYHFRLENDCTSGTTVEHVETLSLSSRLDEHPVALGRNALMTFLYTDASAADDANTNSMVVRLDLGKAAVLLMGDAEAGGSASTEARLLACCKSDLKANALIVGHHGSKTSSHPDFLQAVGAKIFVISAGPYKYPSGPLPDDVVVQRLTAMGELWRTDLDDPGCRNSAHKVGPDSDNRPGGCNSVRISISGSGGVKAGWSPVRDP